MANQSKKSSTPVPSALSTLLKPGKHSMAEWLASQSASERQRCLSGLSGEEKAAACYDWHFWARPSQLAPAGTWRIWLMLAGRGFGKTRAGAEWIRGRVDTGMARRIALVGQTPADVRDVMIEGESGLLAISPPWDRPIYEPSKRRLTWPNGATATTYSGHEPDQLRGPQHDTAWGDEPASWDYPDETFSNLELGLRIGDPLLCLTTTPKPISLLRELVKDPSVHVTSGTSYENAANLSPAFIARIIKRYEGTSLGDQELHARLLDEAPGALWKRAQIEAARISLDELPQLVRIVVAIDPAVTQTEESSETGIVVAGMDAQRHGYVLRDLSGRWSVDDWAHKAVRAYQELRADKIVGEQNNGGDLVRKVVLNADPRAAYKSVYASKEIGRAHV